MDEGDPAEEGTADDKTASPEELKVVLSIKNGRATIGVQQPSADPYIEAFDDRNVTELVQEVPAVVGRAAAKWEDAPKHPAHARPAPSTRRRNRREQGAAQAGTAKGGADQQQPEALKLF